MSDKTERLSMAFNTVEGKVFRINLADPRSDLTAEDVQAVMDSIILSGATAKSALTGVKSADTIVTTTEKLI